MRALHMGISETYVRGRDIATDRPVVVVLALLVGLLVVGMIYELIRQLSTGELLFSRLGTYVWDGLMRGLIIGLAGIGLSMTYSILNFANFAHGDYITAGAFSGWGVTYIIAGLGTLDIGALALVGAGGSAFGGALGINIVSTPIAVIAGLLVAGGTSVVLALGVDRAIFKPIRSADGISLLITSIGVAFTIRYLLLFVFGSGTRGTTNTGNLPEYRQYIIDGVVPINAHDVTLIVVAGGLMLGIHLLLQYSRLGKAMRAMSDNKALAQVTGIPTERVVTTTWVLGGALTGVAGYVFVLWKGTIGFNDGWLLLLLIFAAVILGGIGSIYGAIVGGLVMGLTQSLSIIWIPSSFSRAAAFLVMIVILVVVPKGIFSGRATA